MASIDFPIDQAAFSDALDTVRRAVSGKSSLPILETIRIEAIGSEVVLGATDLQVYISARVAAAHGGRGRARYPGAARSSTGSRALPPGTVRLALTTKATRVRASSGRSTAASSSSTWTTSRARRRPPPPSNSR